MKIQLISEKVVEKNIVNDDGSKVNARTEKKVRELMQAFQSDKVMGTGSYVPDVAALRMAMTVMSRYELRVKRS
jgi:hypothetical protein